MMLSVIEDLRQYAQWRKRQRKREAYQVGKERFHVPDSFEVEAEVSGFWRGTISFSSGGGGVVRDSILFLPVVTRFHLVSPPG
jgi:hypothetical protein